MRNRARLELQAIEIAPTKTKPDESGLKKLRAIGIRVIGIAPTQTKPDESGLKNRGCFQSPSHFGVSSQAGIIDF